MPTIQEIEREAASRLGPFYALTASGGSSDAATVPGLRSNAPAGGYEGLWLLRRLAVKADDRLRTVDRVDFPAGNLLVDFPYLDAPHAQEPLELHHLHPDWQLRADVLAGLRRCWLLDVLDVPAPPANGVYAYANGNGWTNGGRAFVTEVPRDGNGNGWLVVPPPPLEALGAPPPGPGVLAGVNAAPLLSGPPAVVDLTAGAFWLTAVRQVLGVAVNGEAVPPAARWARGGQDGWSAYGNRGRVYLTIPAGALAGLQAGDALQVRAYRDAWGLVNGADDPAGPADDDDDVGVPVDYAAAFAHVEAWRRHRDRLEASAAEGRFATQAEAALEATRVASMYADWLFRPQTERGDRIASPWGPDAGGGGTSPSGLGGRGRLASSVVNQNDPYA